MAGDRWLTFDCYGTIADWNTCMRQALEPVAGDARGCAADRLPSGGTDLRGRAVAAVPGVLTDGLALAARRAGVPLPGPEAGALVAAWPTMTVFDDAGPTR